MFCGKYFFLWKKYWFILNFGKMTSHRLILWKDQRGSRTDSLYVVYYPSCHGSYSAFLFTLYTVALDRNMSHDNDNGKDRFGRWRWQWVTRFVRCLKPHALTASLYYLCRKLCHFFRSRQQIPQRQSLNPSSVQAQRQRPYNLQTSRHPKLTSRPIISTPFANIQSHATLHAKTIFSALPWKDSISTQIWMSRLLRDIPPQEHNRWRCGFYRIILTLFEWAWSRDSLSM